MQTKITKSARSKKCKLKTCGKLFVPRQQFQIVCDPRCAMGYARQQSEMKKKKEIADRKQGLKSLSVWLKEAQAAFNEYIRLRDKDKPCISCGTYTAPQWAAGHYRSVGSCPELRFEEDNVHRQCNMNCNNSLSGNIVEYRKGLKDRIGIERLEWIEGPHDSKHYLIEDVKNIKAEYKLKAKDLRRLAA